MRQLEPFRGDRLLGRDPYVHARCGARRRQAEGEGKQAPGRCVGVLHCYRSYSLQAAGLSHEARTCSAPINARTFDPFGMNTAAAP
jgi:hypothetical protein